MWCTCQLDQDEVDGEPLEVSWVGMEKRLIWADLVGVKAGVLEQEMDLATSREYHTYFLNFLKIKQENTFKFFFFFFFFFFFQGGGGMEADLYPLNLHKCSTCLQWESELILWLLDYNPKTWKRCSDDFLVNLFLFLLQKFNTTTNSSYHSCSNASFTFCWRRAFAPSITSTSWTNNNNNKQLIIKQ